MSTVQNTVPPARHMTSPPVVAEVGLGDFSSGGVDWSPRGLGDHLDDGSHAETADELEADPGYHGPYGNTAKLWEEAMGGIVRAPRKLERHLRLWSHDDTYEGNPVNMVLDRYRGFPAWGGDPSVYPHSFGTCETYDPRLPLKLVSGPRDIKANPSDPDRPDSIESLIGHGGGLIGCENILVGDSAIAGPIYLPWSDLTDCAEGSAGYLVIVGSDYRHEGETFIPPITAGVPGLTASGQVELRRKPPTWTLGYYVILNCYVLDSLVQARALVRQLYPTATNVDDYISSMVSPIDVAPEWRTGDGWINTVKTTQDGAVILAPMTGLMSALSDRDKFSASWYEWRSLGQADNPGSWRWFTINTHIYSKQGWHYSTVGGLRFENNESTDFVDKYVGGGEFDAGLQEIVDPILTRDGYGRRWPPAIRGAYPSSHMAELGNALQNWGDYDDMQYCRDHLYSAGVFKDGIPFDLRKYPAYAPDYYSGEDPRDIVATPERPIGLFVNVEQGGLRHFTVNRVYRDYGYPWFLGTRRVDTDEAWTTPFTGVDGLTCFSMRRSFARFDEYEKQRRPKLALESLARKRDRQTLKGGR